MRIGILGGTFDPIHVGHIAVAHIALECAHLDRVLFIPSFIPPHREPAVADPEQRHEMLALAIVGEPRFQVSDIEIRRGGTSYTIDTIEELKGMHPRDELFLILGWDAARLFGTWHEPSAIQGLASVAVVSRPGVPEPDPAQLAAAGLDPARTVICSGHTPDVSASELRQAIAKGEARGEWLPEPVRRYIDEHALYRHNRQVGC